MPKLFGSLFGSPSKTTQSNTNTSGFSALPQFAQDAFKQAVATGTSLAANPSLFAPAGLTPEQQASLASLSAGLDPTSMDRFQSGINTFSNPYENQVVQSAIGDINTAGQGFASDIAQNASAAGGFGGTRQALLEAENYKNTQKNIGDISGQLRSQGFQNAANMTMADIMRAQDAATNLFGFGETQRGINTATQQAPITANNYLATLAQGLPASSTSNGSSVANGASDGLFGQFGGTAGIGGGLAKLAPFLGFSDSRLKNNIKYIGEENGHNIYEFQYKWSPTKYIGVMAQDVVKYMPEAISVIDGYYTVDYGKLGLQMRVA